MISVLKKELWEVLRWTPLGMLLGVVSVWMQLPTDIDDAASVGPALASQLGLAAAVIAIGLGLLQSIFDTRNDARAYLLHRPIPRTNIWWGKVLAGVCLYTLSLLPAFLFAVVYLESQGLHRFPTTWWQVLPTLVNVVFLFLLHPLAIWIVNRDARWTGTKFLPAIVVLAIVMFNSLFVDTAGSYFEVIVAITLACLCAVVVFVGSHHAFCCESMLSPQTGPLSRSWASKIANTLSAVIAVVAVGIFLFETFRTQESERVDYHISLNSAGEFQQVKTTRSLYNWNDVLREVRPVDPNADFRKADKPLDERLIASFRRTHRGVNIYPHLPKHIVEAASSTVPLGDAILVTLDNNLLVYNHRGLEKSITSFVRDEDGNRQFEDLKMERSLNQVGSRTYRAENPIFAELDGVYQFDSEALELRELYEGNSVETCLLLGQGNGPASLWTIENDVLREHTIESVDPDKNLMVKPEREDRLTFGGNFELPLLRIVDSKEYKIQPLGVYESMSLTRNREGALYFVRHSFDTNSTVFGEFDNNDRPTELGSFTYPQKKPDPLEYAAGWIFPPGGMIIVNIVMTLLGFNAWGYIVIIPAVIMTLISAVGAWWFAGYRGLGPRPTVAWILTAALLGPGVWWAIIACYKRLIKEKCTYCGKAARVELDACEHCQQVWAEPDPDGIEIFERPEFDSSVAL